MRMTDFSVFPQPARAVPREWKPLSGNRSRPGGDDGSPAKGKLKFMTPPRRFPGHNRPVWDNHIVLEAKKWLVDSLAAATNRGEPPHGSKAEKADHAQNQ